jgi:hypothetical protein
MRMALPLNASDHSRRSVTDRQARFLVPVMRHAGVFIGRQYAAFAGITHGQKVHDFIQTLVVRRFATLIELGTTGRTRIIHVHYKPLYAAIGEPANRNRRCVTIDRTIHRLMILDAVLADRSVNWLGSEREKRHYFEARLRDNLRDNEYPRLVFGKPRDVTIPILSGQASDRLRAGPTPPRVPLSRAQPITDGVLDESSRQSLRQNAVIESWFSTVKSEEGERFESYAHAKEALFDYIEVFYDQRRRHSTLGQISPAEFERRTTHAA